MTSLTQTEDQQTDNYPGRRKAVIGLGIVSAGVALAVFLGHRGPTERIVWNDGFGGKAGSSPSSDDWLLDVGTNYPGGPDSWGTGEIETYTRDPGNIALDGAGHLRITAGRDRNGQWYSARLETRRADFRPARGQVMTIEASIQLPDGGNGYWPAFWMLGEPFRRSLSSWPASGEIDVMEHLGREPSVIHGTLHCGVYNGGPCDESAGLTGARSGRTDGFHTYALAWDRSRTPEELRWSVDGVVYHRVSADDLKGAAGAAAWQAATGHGYFLVLNVAIGGAWAGLPDRTTRPGASMLVDRVTVRSSE